jgi:hypothetical protein
LQGGLFFLERKNQRIFENRCFARGPIFSARQRAKLAGQTAVPIVEEADIYGADTPDRD